MARRRKGRNINGIFLLNKDLGGSSNQVLQQVRRIYAAAKAGHTGALDPLASGMLPICLGEATKFSQFLLDADKTYEVTAKLGIRTTTSDADGEVVETKPVDVSQTQLTLVCQSFLGHSKQIPSMFSALKYQGKPLYFYARQGIEVPREARDIHIYQLDLLRFEHDEVDMLVRCSKGTYIRSLVDDIGQLLGCGAFVTRLNRIQVSGYPTDNMMTIEQLENVKQGEGFTDIDKLLLPMDTAVNSLPSVVVDVQGIHNFTHGQAAQSSSADNISVGELVRVYLADEYGNVFYGVGEVQPDGSVAPKRVVVY